MSSESLTQYGFGVSGEYDPRTNLRNILGKSFVLKNIRDTPFDGEKYEAVPDAVTIRTAKYYEVDGAKVHEFYATWKVVTGKLKNAKLREDLAKGIAIPALKLVKVTSKKDGNSYYDLIPA